MPQAGFVAGYMGNIPSSWQSEFGGPALTGQSNIPIISRTSLGPAAFVFDPAQVGVLNPAPATKLVYYPSGHTTLGGYETANPNASQSTEITGVVFPVGSRSVLFFGRHGLGACYGTGAECNDPADSSKGTHGYPYVHQIWAYDANDLLAVKKGTKQPWDVFPYGVWTYDLPIQKADRRIIGAAYDPTSQRIYLSQEGADGDLPLVQVFELQLGPVVDSAAPSISITAPLSNTNASGIVAVSATASDDIGVSKVEFYVNGSLKASDISTPYLFTWDTSSLASGTYILAAKAYDASGKVAQSDNVYVSVEKNSIAPQPPTGLKIN